MGNILLTNNNLTIYDRLIDLFDKYITTNPLLPMYDKRQDIELYPINNTNIDINEDYDYNLDQFQDQIKNIDQQNINQQNLVRQRSNL